MKKTLLVGAALAAAVASTTLGGPRDLEKLARTRAIDVSAWQSRGKTLTVHEPAEVAAIVSEVRGLERVPSPAGWHGTSHFVFRPDTGDAIHAEAVLDEGGLLGVLDGLGGMTHYRLTRPLRERLETWVKKAIAASKKLTVGSLHGARISYEEQLFVHRIRIDVDDRAHRADAWLLARDGRAARLVDRAPLPEGGLVLDFDGIERPEIVAVVVSIDGVPRSFRLD